MTFENAQLDVIDLPQYQGSDYHPLEQSYQKMRYVISCIFVVILVAAPISTYFIFDEERTIALPIALAIWGLISLIILLVVGPAFRQKGYAVREKDISYKKGLITRHTTTIPFNRVQHCDISQGPISRYFGLSKLNIYTAGGANSDLSIPGLSRDTAEKLMDYVLQKTLQSDEEE